MSPAAAPGGPAAGGVAAMREAFVRAVEHCGWRSDDVRRAVACADGLWRDASNRRPFDRGLTNARFDVTSDGASIVVGDLPQVGAPADRSLQLGERPSGSILAMVFIPGDGTGA